MESGGGQSQMQGGQEIEERPCPNIVPFLSFQYRAGPTKHTVNAIANNDRQHLRHIPPDCLEPPSMIFSMIFKLESKP